MTRLIVKSFKPRNPLVAPARFRLAGAHGRRRRADRRDGRQALQRELDQLHSQRL